MITEAHAVAVAQHPVSMRTVLLLLGWTLEAADVLPTLSLVVVAIGATQATTRGIGRAVWIIASVQQRLGIEVFIAPVVVEDCDAPLVMHPGVVGYLIMGRVPQLNLPRQHGHGQGAAMANELAALIGARRISRIA